MKKLIIIALLLFPLFAFASDQGASGNTTQSCETTNADGSVSLCNPLTGKANNVEIPTILGKVINNVLGIVGSLALVMFIYGGIIWMTSAGNAEQVSKGKNILIWAAVGIVIIFTSYALVKFVLTSLPGA